MKAFLVPILWFFSRSCFAMTTPSVPEFWSSKQVCEFLGVPLSTLRYWQWQRTGPRSYRIGRHRKYKPADVRAWAERQAEEPLPGRK
jgi:hypothetical protein